MCDSFSTEVGGIVLIERIASSVYVRDAVTFFRGLAGICDFFAKKVANLLSRQENLTFKFIASIGALRSIGYTP